MSGPAWIECPRCGKTWRDDDVEYIHTCTPKPVDNAAQPDEEREWGELFQSWLPAMFPNATMTRVDAAANELSKAVLARLAGGKQQVSLEQVREAFDAQLVVDARIPPEVESAFGTYVTQLRDRVIASLLSDRRLP
jgi:hypothetical protein